MVYFGGRMARINKRPYRKYNPPSIDIYTHPKNGLHISRELILRGVGLIYTIAFLSLYSQLPGLFGCDGLKPANSIFVNNTTFKSYFTSPTLFWYSQSLGFNTIDPMMEVMCLIGIVFGLLELFGQCWNVFYLIQWIFYLSFFMIGQPFLHFQWDILLLEAGFLTIFLARWSPFQFKRRLNNPILGLLWLFRFLLFKLMFLSGIVKLITSQKSNWNDLTAMNYHYATQCIPNPISYFLHQLPSFVHELETVGTLVIEIPLTFCLFLPSYYLREIAALTQIFLQIMILLSGNYNFFNILTIILCFSFLENRFWDFRHWKNSKKYRLLNYLGFIVIFVIFFFLLTKIHWNAYLPTFTLTVTESSLKGMIKDYFWIYLIFFFISFIINYVLDVIEIFSNKKYGTTLWSIFIFVFCLWVLIISPLNKTAELHENEYYLLVKPQSNLIRDFHITNEYGLFRSMTGVGSRKEVARPEVIIEGYNGTHWHEISFPYKPGDVSRRPPLVAPHQPRLDW